MASNNSSATGTVFLDTTSAQVALDRLNSKIKAYDNELTKANTSAARRLTVERDRAAAAEKAAGIQQQIEKGLGATYNQQAALIKTLTNQTKNLAVGTDEYRKKLADLRKAQGVFDEMKQKISGVEAEQEKMGSGFTRAFSRIAQYAAAYFAFDQVTSFLSDAVEEADAAEKATSRLQNTLSNLGRNDAFERITGQADKLAETFTFLDNDDITEVFQQLITYGKLTENQMNELLPVIINFASKSGISLNESASVIIKAMEGNAKALKEYGINIKDGSTVTERFGILMTELKPKVEGAADAFGETFAGKTAIAKQEVANLKEEIGTKMLPILKNFYATIPLVIEGLQSIFEKTAAFFSGAYDRIKLTLGLAKDLVTFNASGAGARLDAFRAEQDAIIRTNRLQKERLEIQQQVEAVASDAAKKTAEEQETLLRRSIATRDASLAAYKEITRSGKFKAEEEHRAALQYIRDRDEVLALEKVIAQTKDKRTLGGGDPNADPEADKKAASAAKKAADDRKRLLEQYNEFVRGLNQSITDILTPESSKKFVAIIKESADELEKLKKIAQGDEQFQKGRALILEKQRIAIHALVEEEAKLYKPAPEQRSTVDASSLTGPLKNLVPKGPVKVPIEVVPEIKPEDEKVVTAALAAVLDRLQRNSKAGFQLDVLQARNASERKNALLAQLEDEHSIEMQNKDLTDNEKLVKEAEYNKKRKEIVNQYQEEIVGVLQKGLEFASQAIDVMGQFAQAATARENAALQKEIKNNDVRKKLIQDQANKRLISSQEAARQISAIDQEQEKRKEALDKKQFERNKKLQLAQAAINGALAITNIWATTPKYDFGVSTYIMLGLSAIATLASLAQIASAKFAQGGRVNHPGNGKIRTAQNIPTQSNGDNVLATVRTGEVILNEEQQRRLGGSATFRAIGVPGFATGGVVRPFWQSRPYRSIDFNRVQQSMQLLRFAEGGRVPAQGSGINQTTGGKSDPVVFETLQQTNAVNIALMDTINALQEQLAGGINVSLKKIEDASAKRNRIRGDSEMR